MVETHKSTLKTIYNEIFFEKLQDYNIKERIKSVGNFE